MIVKDITDHLEAIAPLHHQESYDNSGLLVGSNMSAITGILITLDVTEAVIDEAIEHGINLIVAHHPLIFSGIKKLNSKHWVDRCIVKAIKNDICIYAIHTNLDNVINGVNMKICERLGLINTRILSPKHNTLLKLVTFIPKADKEKVQNALFEAGAGVIGNYSECSFEMEGRGNFKPNGDANPTIGKLNTREIVEEVRLEVMLPTDRQHAVIGALKLAHPYEKVAYYLSNLENQNQEIGAGMIGELSSPVPTKDFLKSLKSLMSTHCVRHTSVEKKMVSKIAVCGGSGSFLLKAAIQQQADIFITGDFKYHEFFEADNKIVIADIGHYESEQFTKDLLYDILSKKFANIALRLSEVETNPIKYL
ncbi:MAG: Nif3-like dinuclear metal center hexameric protein [Cyclobacteriaceae bacterium]